MKLALVKDHLNFFYQNHFLECEDLLSQKALTQLREALIIHIKTQISSVSKRDKNHLETPLLKAGFDSWRFSDLIKKWVFQPHFVEIAAHLTKRKKLRLGFDQAFWVPPFFEEESDQRLSFFKKSFFVSQISSLNNMVCGLILNLSLSSDLIEENNNNLPLPKIPGNGLFFLINNPLCFNQLLKNSKKLFLLIIYTEEQTIYFLNKENPNAHTYKNLGYVFGDKLQNKTHPLIYSK